MEVNARIDKALRHIRIIKRGSWDTQLSPSDAKKLFDSGKVTKFNVVFSRLAQNDFDVTATLGWYQEERDRLLQEKADDGP